MTERLTIEQATALATRALEANGAGRPAAESVARAVVAAHARGRTNVGFQHIPYYCEALKRGAVNGRDEPDVDRVRPGVLHVDARSGFTHYAFDRAFDAFAGMARGQGVAMLSIAHTFTCGELGYFPDRLARVGLIALAATNAGPAAVAPSGAGRAVFSTNPIAYAFPRGGKAPLLVDQSSSACTLVDVHAARNRGESIPADWALDPDGNPTEDPEAALAGSFKPFGGTKGSNIALLVELLAAGLSGGNWSMDAPSFAEGPDCPDVGQWFLAMDPGAAGDAATDRIEAYLDGLEALGAHMPGRHRAAESERALDSGIELPGELYATIQSYCGPE